MRPRQRPHSPDHEIRLPMKGVLSKGDCLLSPFGNRPVRTNFAQTAWAEGACILESLCLGVCLALRTYARRAVTLSERYAMRTFRHVTAPAVYTKGPNTYTIGGLPCQKCARCGISWTQPCFTRMLFHCGNNNALVVAAIASDVVSSCGELPYVLSSRTTRLQSASGGILRWIRCRYSSRWRASARFCTERVAMRCNKSFDLARNLFTTRCGLKGMYFFTTASKGWLPRFAMNSSRLGCGGLDW